jgi:hypothetical protein
MQNIINKPWFIVIKKSSELLSNVVIIIGIIFAYEQLEQQTQLEKTRIAIETITQIRDVQFLVAYSELVSIYKQNRLDNVHTEITYTRQLNIVLSSFNSIEILYTNDLANKCIIKKSVSPFINEFGPVLDYVLGPFDTTSSAAFKKQFDSLAQGLKQNVCGD